jgi:diguanylate cyclase (GGDEF)-like protein
MRGPVHPVRNRSLLCGSDAERGRLVDMSRRLSGAKRGATLALAVAVVIGMPTFGFWYAIPLAAAGLAFWAGQVRLDYVRRPEYVLAASWLFAQLMFAVAIAVAHGPQLYLLALFILPLLLWSVAFPPAAAAGAVVVTALLMTLTAFLVDAHTVLHTPFALLYPLTVIVAASIPAAAVRDLDAQSRQTAVVDQLTGLLNRVALESRVAELSHQTAVTGRPVALVLGDIDHFKAINDTHGHARGDEVLKEVAGRMSHLLEHEPVFRLGGEEFLVLLADVDAVEAQNVAERLRAAVRQTPIDGLRVTMSFGVACSPPEETLDYEQLFARADAALYRAKHDGRDRVAGAGATSSAPVPAPEPAANVIAFDRRRSKRGSVPAPPPDIEPVKAHARDHLAEERAASRSWLVQDDVEREHLIDLGRRIHQRNRPAYIVTFGAVIGAAFTYGWPTVVAPLLAAVLYNVVEHSLDRMRRPEYALGLMWLVAQGANAIGIGLVHLSSAYPPLYALPLMVIMTIGSSAVFPRRGAAIGVAFAAFVTAAAGVAINPALAAQDPGIIALSVSLVISAGLIGAAAGRSAVDHRGAAVVDQLTGMLNRGALEARVAELSHHATAVGQQVAVIVADLDHFKTINDTYGHTTGDEVLQAVAYRIRKHLRAFESAYRVGGEEFVVLLPGVSVDDAETIAQRIWEAVREEPIGELKVTISLGLAASDPQTAFDYGSIFGQADAALYEAKHIGRDRVCRNDALAESLAA